MSNEPTKPRLLSDEEVEKIANAYSGQKTANGPELVRLIGIVSDGVPALLADRQARKEREAKAIEALKEISRGKSPDDQNSYEIMAARLVGIARKTLSLLSQ